MTDWNCASPLAAETGTRERPAGKLTRINADLVATGDAFDPPCAARIERTVGRHFRRWAIISDALRAPLAGQWP